MIGYFFVFVVSVFSLFFGMWVCLKKHMHEENESVRIEDSQKDDDDETIDTECAEVIATEEKSDSVLSKLVSRESYTELACEGDGVSEEEYIRQRMKEQDKKYGQK